MFIGFGGSFHMVMAWVGSSECSVHLLVLFSVKVFMRLWNWGTEARTISVKVLTRCLTFDILLFYFYVFTRSFDKKQNAKMVIIDFLHLFFCRLW